MLAETLRMVNSPWGSMNGFFSVWYPDQEVFLRLSLIRMR